MSGNGDYDVFTPDTNESIIRAFVASTGIAVGDSVLDLGCGSGCFSRLLQRAGYCVTAVNKFWYATRSAPNGLCDGSCGRKC